jgi:hypothetical protein
MIKKGLNEVLVHVYYCEEKPLPYAYRIYRGRPGLLARIDTGERIWNPLNTSQSFHLESSIALVGAFRVNLKEETLDTLDLQQINILLSARGLATLRLVSANNSNSGKIGR